MHGFRRRSACTAVQRAQHQMQATARILQQAGTTRTLRVVGYCLLPRSLGTGQCSLHTFRRGERSAAMRHRTRLHPLAVLFSLAELWQSTMPQRPCWHHTLPQIIKCSLSSRGKTRTILAGPHLRSRKLILQPRNLAAAALRRGIRMRQHLLQLRIL